MWGLLKELGLGLVEEAASRFAAKRARERGQLMVLVELRKVATGLGTSPSAVEDDEAEALMAIGGVGRLLSDDELSRVSAGGLGTSPSVDLEACEAFVAAHDEVMAQKDGAR